MRGYGYESIADVESIPRQDTIATLRNIMRWEVRCWSGIAELDEATALEQLSQKLKTQMSQVSRFGAITRWIKQFSPTMFPTEIALSFLNAATAEVANSGSDVPKATTLIPITISDIPRYRAKNIAPSTNKFAPSARAIVPPMIYKIELTNERSL